MCWRNKNRVRVSVGETKIERLRMFAKQHKSARTCWQNERRALENVDETKIEPTRLLAKQN